MRFPSTAGLAVASALWMADFARSEVMMFEVAKAASAFDSRSGSNVLEIELEDSKVLGEFTKRHIGKKADIRADGKLLASPFVYEPIVDGKFWLSPFDQVELERLVEQLSKEGAALEIEVLPD